MVSIHTTLLVLSVVSPKGNMKTYLERAKDVCVCLFTKLPGNMIGRSDHIDYVLLNNIDWEIDA